MELLTNKLGWALSDALGFKIDFDDEKLKITGGDDIKVKIAGAPVIIPAKVVSSMVTEAATMAVVKLIGNLAAFVVVKKVKNEAIVELYVLNVAKMDATFDWLEKKRPASVNEALEKFGAAVVARFIKYGSKAWKEL